jgi:hypothetical protein
MRMRFPSPHDLRGLLRDPRGAHAVELAIVFPVLLLMTFAIIDFGRLLFEINGAHKAAQLGADLAITRDPIALPVKYHFACNAPSNLALVGQSCRAPDGTLRPECDFGTVVCTSAGCTHDGSTYALGSDEASQTLFDAVLERMRIGLPRLEAADIEITYRPSDLGFVGRPVPVAEVTVAVRNVPFSFIAMPASALVDMEDIVVPAQTVTLTSEDLSDNSCAEQGLKDGTGGASGTCVKGNSTAPEPVCFP